MSDPSATKIESELCPECGAHLPGAEGQAVCPSCGALFFRQQLPPGAAGQGALVKGMRFKTHSCVDTQGVGMESFSLLIPAGWEFGGGLQWNMMRPAAPVSAAFQVRNPYGQEALEGLPMIPFSWNDNPLLLSNFPVGSIYLGNEVRPPLDVLQALREIVVPRYRGREVDLQIVREELLPDLPRQLGKVSGMPQPDPNAHGAQAYGPHSTCEGGKVRLRYRHGAQVLEEEIWGVVETTRFRSAFMFSIVENVFWSADDLFGIRGLAETVDKLADLFGVMTRSFRVNPEWYVRYMAMVQNMVQAQIWQINSIGQLGRWWSQAYGAAPASYVPPYIPYQPPIYYPTYPPPIPATQRPANPFEEDDMAWPESARYGWTNDRGEFILAAEATYDPNAGGGQEWRRLKRAT